MPLKTARRALVSMTLAGFALPGSARASSSSGSSSSGSSSSGSSSSGSSASATATTAATSLVATVAGVVVTVAVVNANRRGKGDWEDGWDRTDRARALLDSGIIDTRSNLAVEVSVVMTDPDTFERMNRDVADGGGPSLSALAEAANLSPDVVAMHWRDARIAYGPVESEADASAFTVVFLSHLARDLTVDPTTASAMVWELARERAQPDFPTNASTHRWLAAWMGIPLRSATLATDAALGSPTRAVQADTRAQIYADPTPYLNRLSAHIGRSHAKEVDRRVRGLVAGVLPWWPEDEPVPDIPDAPEAVRPQDDAQPDSDKPPPVLGTP